MHQDPFDACQRIVNTKSLSHHTLAQCDPLRDLMPTAPLRQKGQAYLVY